jgi:hypothetical protein
LGALHEPVAVVVDLALPAFMPSVRLLAHRSDGAPQRLLISDPLGSADELSVWEGSAGGGDCGCFAAPGPTEAQLTRR